MTRILRPISTFVAVAALAAGAYLPAQAGHCAGGHAAETASASADIVDTAINAGDFTTLVAAVQAAGLVDALKAEGPLTVFAPTDEAFAALPEGTVESLLLPENKDQLVAILTYHVVEGAVESSVAVTLTEAKTLNGQKFQVRYADETLMIDDATVVKADIKTANGVIHVIDKVLIPAPATSR
jgi:uncharacterized surface protein with fasciclin (FAS1) repeats